MHSWPSIRFRLSCLARWCEDRIEDRFISTGGTIHILFCTVDHFEPGAGNADVIEERARMRLLLSRYPQIADRHRDSDGRPPRRTWFFPPHYHRNGNLKDLVTLCAGGYGEIELHLHHGKTAPDTEANLCATIRQTVGEYGAFGIFGTENGRRRYGFIHGDWALDNCRANRYCGVNSELTVLRETGCYADFTYPAMSVPEANPKKTNSIYYATDDPGKPKSHKSGRDVERGRKPTGDIMIVEGCVHPSFTGGNAGGFRVVGDALTADTEVTASRIDLWVKTGIHVRGKRNWVFIKTHTHGAVDSPVVTGKPFDDALTYMEARYNDGTRYVLHYVTARELYNIAKAIEANEPGENPDQYRDYAIAQPRYDPATGATQASERLQALVARTYRG